MRIYRQHSRGGVLVVLLAAVLGWAAPRAAGAPSVSGVSGDIAQRSTITISGSSFGAAPTVVLFDDFENGSNGQGIKTGAGSAAYGQWTSKDGTPYYTNTTSVSGSLAFQADMSIGWAQFVEATLPAGTRDFFMSWWMYIPSGDKIPGEGTPDTTNWKTVWVMGSGTTDDDITLPTILDTSMLITANGSPYTKYLNIDFQKGEWKRVWVWTKGGYSNDGQCHYWELDSTNAVIQRVNDNNVTLMNSGGIRERVHINGYGRTTPNCHPSFEDVYIATGANARARVEIGNSPTYNNCTRLAICVPTSWSDASITAMANVGGLSGGPWYMFVFDANGAVSSGFQLDTQKYALTVNSGTGSGTYYPGKVVNVSADAPASGMVFDRWTGNTAALANPTASSTTCTMPASNVETTATYKAAVYYVLTVNSGSGSGTYLAGQVVAIAANAPASGKTFDRWIGDTANIASVTSASSTLTMPAVSQTITATYKNLYLLTVNSGSGTGSYPAGQVVAIAANAPASGMTFDRWTGDTAGLANPTASSTTCTMPASNVQVTATYKSLPRYTLTVHSGTGSGSYLAGQVVAVVADAPASGMVFNRWTGNTSALASATSASTTCTMPASNVEITATYRVGVAYHLTVNSGSGSGTYLEGSVVGIAADSAPEGFVFAWWTGDVGCVADPLSASTTVTMPQANAVVTALFTRPLSTMRFREGGGSGFVNATFDDTWIVYNPADDTTHGNNGWDGLQTGPGRAYLMAVKDMFTYLPKTTAGYEIHVVDSKVHFWRYAGTSSQQLTLNRITTNWLPGAAGTNENNVSGMYAVRSTSTRWASGGNFSSSDYDTSVVTTGAWGDYAEPQPELIYNVTGQIAGIYETGANFGLSVRANGDIIGRASEYGTLASRPYLEVSYYYEPFAWALTVNSGSGGGIYASGTNVNITADAAPSGKTFDKWTGDTSGITNINAASTTITMPASNATVTATYKDILYALTVNSGSGSGSYEAGTVVNIQANAGPSGKQFDKWTGDTSGISNVNAAGTTITMPASNATVTGTYKDILYALTVNSGSGSGSYAAGTVVNIQANAGPSGKQFDKWTGDTSGITNVNAASTTVTMPAANAALTATYKFKGDLNGDGFVGQGDLDIVLSMWGRSGSDITDRRADADGNDFVGQGDLDHVLADWGKGQLP